MEGEGRPAETSSYSKKKKERERETGGLITQSRPPPAAENRAAARGKTPGRRFYALAAAPPLALAMISVCTFGGTTS